MHCCIFVILSESKAKSLTLDNLLISCKLTKKVFKILIDFSYDFFCS